MGKALKKDTERRPLRKPPYRRIKRPEAPPVRPSALREISALLLLALAAFFALALGSYYYLGGESGLKPFSFENAANSKNLLGPAGYFLSGIMVLLLGWCSWVSVFWSALLAHSIWSSAPKSADKNEESSAALYLGAAVRIAAVAVCSAVMLMAGAALCTIVFGENGGGLIGAAIERRLVPYVSPVGASILCGVLFLAALTLSTGFSTFSLVRATGKAGSRSKDLMLGAAVYSGKVSGRAIGAAVKAAGQRQQRAILELAPPPRRSGDNAGAARPLDLDYARPPEDGYILGNGLDKKLAKKRKQPAVQAEALPPGPAFLPPLDDDFNFEFEDEAGAGLAEHTASKPMIKKRMVEDSSAQRKKKELKKRSEPAVDCIPSTELLLPVDPLAIQSAALSEDELLRNSRRLEQTLMDFRIGGKVVEVHPGPVITLYEFEPAAGVKVNRVVNLADDLALALKVSSVRVYAPVPGKGTVGIEVPNREREIVRLREIVESKEFSVPSMALGLAIGKDTFGDPFVTDLSAMPHLLIAGSTGTGKSVCINSMLLSLLFRHPPEELRLIMIDPKMLELSVYEEIPHLKAPVVTNPKRARGVLWWAVEEMERRYRLMRDLGVRNVAGYNTLILGGRPSPADAGEPEDVIELEEKNVVAAPEGASLGRSEGSGSPGRGMVDRETRKRLISEGELLPRIVIVVDELADLMLTVGREIEELLTRLAQKARAAGLHLILATQRPSVNVITGLIKANFPARISFKVASKIDARTVMDTSGAEKLLGQGDMLFVSPGVGRVRRLHGAFVSDEEVHQVVDWLRSQGAPDYDSEIEGMIEKIEEAEAGQSAGGEAEEYDPLYDQAVNVILEKGQASTSFVQRVFRIGYNRAARILETMEREGIVGPADGAKPRQIMAGAKSSADRF